MIIFHPTLGAKLITGAQHGTTVPNSPPKNIKRIESQSSNNPQHSEHTEYTITEFLICCVFSGFCCIKEYVSTVVEQQDQCANSIQIADPAERQQGDRRNMVDKHLPKVLVADVPELGYGQRPVERRRDHVVPPDVIC